MKVKHGKNKVGSTVAGTRRLLLQNQCTLQIGTSKQLLRPIRQCHRQEFENRGIHLLVWCTDHTGNRGPSVYTQITQYMKLSVQRTDGTQCIENAGQLVNTGYRTLGVHRISLCV